MDDPTKQYSLLFEERLDYRYPIIRRPTMDRTTALAFLGEVAATCKSLSCKRLLLERDVPTMLPDADLFFTTNDFAQMMGDIRVAFYNPHQSIEEQMEFAILIGTNRGARFSVHDTIAAAEAWLGA